VGHVVKLVATARLLMLQLVQPPQLLLDQQQKQ
jgi:hypothetical protein